jgi:DNA-binding MarR family transcriptional regulator
VLVELTEAGRVVLDQAVSANSGQEKELIANLTRQEQKVLAGLLKKLLAGLEPITGDGAG